MIGAHTGLPWPAIYHKRGGGGPPPYHANAVHFDGNTFFSRVPMIGVVNSPTGLLSSWLKITPGVDPRSNYLFNNANSDCAFANDDAGDGFARISAILYDVPNTSHIYGHAPYSDIPLGNWQLIQYSWDTNFPVGSRRLQIGVNGEIYEAIFVEDEGPAFSVEISGYNVSFFSFGPGDPSANFTGDAADFYMRVGGPFFDLTASNPFITGEDGKPTDPSTWPTGGCAIFSGDSASFATNQGSGGAVAVTGALTNASSSPSD